MSMSGSRGTRAVLLTGVAFAALVVMLPAQARVGVTSQTTNNPTGTPPAQQQRTLKVGIDVFANERIQTTANDRAHLLFLDGSSLTVGPNSDLMIDKFVFDPASGTGELAVSATKGIFRLVGGKITKTNEATIKVGTSTIGIRGGITIVNAPECPAGASPADCQAQAYFMFGQQLSVTNADGTQTATRPGSLIAFGKSGPPAPPVIAPPNSLVGPIAQLEAPAGTGNTGPVGPAGAIEQKTAASNLPPTNSGTPPDPTNGAPSNAQVANNTTGAGSAVTNTPDPNVPPQTPPPPNHEPPPPPPGTVISFEGRFVREAEFVSATFTEFGATAPRDTTNNAYLASASVSNGRLTATSVNGYSADLPWMPGFEFNVTDGIASDSGNTMVGRGFVPIDEDFYFYRVREANGVGRRNIIFGGERALTAAIPSGGFRAFGLSTLDPAEAPFLSPLATTLPVVANAVQGDMYVASAPLNPPPGSNTRATWFQATLNIQGQGEAQSSYLSIGTGILGNEGRKGADAPYLGGGQQAFIRESAFGGSTKYSTDVATAETQGGSAIYGPGGSYMVLVPERVIDDGATRESSVGWALPFDTLEVGDITYPVSLARAVNGPADLGTVRTEEVLSGFVGALVENNNGGGMSSYAAYNSIPGQVTMVKQPSSNRAVGTFNLTNDGGDNIQLQWGSLTGTASQQQSSYIDDKRFAMRESHDIQSTYNGSPIVTQMSMVTQAAVPDADFLPAGVSFCTCQYLTWGYWQGDLNYTTGPLAGQRDYVTLGTWVTGNLAADIDLPLSGTATYSGHIIGNVENDSGNSYVAAGSYSNAWSFGSRTGTLSITNFDNANYTGTTTGAPGSVNFSGSFTGTGDAANRSGQVRGAFFNAPGPDGKAAYQAGNFNLTSTGNYKAAGTFASQRGVVTPPSD